VKRKARQWIEDAADRMAAHLLKLANFAESQAVQLKATGSALDRAELKPPTEIAVGAPSTFDTVFHDIAAGSRAESRARRGIDEDDRHRLTTAVPAKVARAVLSSMR
jgi:hypothetical protein